MSLRNLHRKLNQSEFSGNEFDPISAFEAESTNENLHAIPSDRFTEPLDNYTDLIHELELIKPDLANALKDLNTYQLQAVLSDDKKVLLSAMVGSGKTTVLTNKKLYRQKWLF